MLLHDYPVSDGHSLACALTDRFPGEKGANPNLNCPSGA
jgi:hypothetical protein